MRSRDGNWTSQSCQQIIQNIRPYYGGQQKHVFPLVNSPSLSRKSAVSSGSSHSVLNPLGGNQAITVLVTNFQKQATFNEAIVY